MPSGSEAFKRRLAYSIIVITTRQNSHENTLKKDFKPMQHQVFINIHLMKIGSWAIHVCAD